MSHDDSTPLARRSRGRLLLTLAITGAVLVLTATANAASGPGRGSRDIRMEDDCEVVSFNSQGLGDLCEGDGQTTFEAFIAELEATQEADDWRFKPEEQDLRRGEALTVRNDGGEVHTLTKVANYGGGFVPLLNELSGNPVPCPECAVVQPDGSLAPPPASPSNLFVDPGQTVTVDRSVLSRGLNRFQCLFHPWMRTEVTLRSR